MLRDMVRRKSLIIFTAGWLVCEFQGIGWAAAGVSWCLSSAKSVISAPPEEKSSFWK